MRLNLANWLIVLAGSVAVMSLLTLIAYAWDKRQATRSRWRIPEKRLHLFSLLGGWPGALVGQRLLRHKTVKPRFRVVFWITVLGHVLFAAGMTYGVWRSVN